MDKGMRQTYIT